MRRNHAVYFGAVGGTGALIGRAIRTAEVIAYEDLGTEAIRRLTCGKAAAHRRHRYAGQQSVRDWTAAVSGVCRTAF